MPLNGARCLGYCTTTYIVLTLLYFLFGTALMICGLGMLLS